MMARWVRSGAAKAGARSASSAVCSGTAISNRLPAPGCAFEPDAALHALDDAFDDGEAKTRAVRLARAGFGLLEFLENLVVIRGRDADAGIADLEQDFAGPFAGLDHDRDAALRRELDGIAGEIQQHLFQPRLVTDHARRQSLVDIACDLETLALRAHGEQFGQVFDHGGKRERPRFEIETAGFDPGEIEDFLDQRQQRVAGRLHRARIGRLFGVSRVSSSRSAMPIMPLSGVRISWLAIARKRDLARFAASDWSRASPSASSDMTRSVTSRPTLWISVSPFSPRTAPSRQAIQRAPCRGRDLLVVDAAAVRERCGVTLFEHAEREVRAVQRVLGLVREFAERFIGERDRAARGAAHDQVALHVEERQVRAPPPPAISRCGRTTLRCGLPAVAHGCATRGCGRSGTPRRCRRKRTAPQARSRTAPDRRSMFRSWSTTAAQSPIHTPTSRKKAIRAKPSRNTRTPPHGLENDCMPDVPFGRPHVTDRSFALAATVTALGCDWIDTGMRGRTRLRGALATACGIAENFRNYEADAHAARRISSVSAR